MLQLVLIAAVACCVVEAHITTPRYFTISDSGEHFVKDGNPFRIVSAGFHYFRVPSEEWEARLDTIASSGVNAITTYIPWNFHCPASPGVCSFEGDRNISRFIDLVHQRGLLVVIRPGPYICAEWEFGGFPAWLLKMGYGMKLRMYDPDVLALVEEWFGQLFREVGIVSKLYSEGGPIVMIQVENEYGQYPSGLPDRRYLEALRDLLQRLTAPALFPVVLYSTDPDRPENILNSAIPGVFQAVDFFYWGTEVLDVQAAWRNQRLGMDAGTSRRGPRYNGEMYPGWLTQWTNPSVKTQSVQYVVNLTHNTLVTYSGNATSSANFYMFFGGTNFGFWAGELCTTSYDYGAPINESGHVTPMFAALKPLLSTLPFVDGPKGVFSEAPPLTAYGEVVFGTDSYRCLPAALDLIANVSSAFNRTPTMEEVGQYYGWTSYTYLLPPDGDIVISLDCRDYCTAYGYVSRSHQYEFLESFFGVSKISFAQRTWPFESVTIVVSNAGRKNFWVESQLTPTLFNKGIVGPVMMNGVEIDFVLVHTLPMEWPQLSRAWDVTAGSAFQPGTGCLLRGSLVIDRVEGGTLLDMRSWSRGLVLINGHNLGRFWTAAGPQRSLFVPSSYLRNGTNDIIVVSENICSSSTPALVASSTNYNNY